MPYQRGGGRLLVIAEEMGFAYLRTSRRGMHVLLIHKQSGGIVCVPLGVSEQGRNFDNYRLALRRAADLATAPAAADPCRPSRPRRPTGEAIQRAERIAARLDNANHTRVCDAIERHDQRVEFYSRLMTSRFTG